jgi:hypothetical protein
MLYGPSAGCLPRIKVLRETKGFGARVNAGLKVNFVVLAVPELMCYTDRVQQSSVPDAIVLEMQRGYCSSALFFLFWF